MTPTLAPEPAPTTAAKVFKHPIFWVPTLYLAMGIPFNVINSTASSMFKSLGVSDGQNTVALGSVIIAWSLKPLWAAFLDMYRTKKFFVIAMELLMPVLFAGVAMSLPLSGFFRISIALLWVAAFASSTQDICGDGIYLTSLDKKKQASLAGVQGMAWNLGKVLATGVLISGMETLANSHGWSLTKMWSGVWIVTAIVMALFAVYHVFLLPPGSIAHRPHSTKQVVGDFVGSATTFFHKRAFWGMIAFVFLYRLGEGLIMVEGKLFIQSDLASGGLGLTAGQVANIDAVYGTIAAIVGGILGGLYLGEIGLKRSLPILGLCLNVPHFTFVYLSHYGAAKHGLDYGTIATLVSIEKFGYGFGFIGNMVYMMQQFAPGRCTMTHYAFATALMNFVLAPTTMISGPLAEYFGFSTFFIVVMFASVPSVLVAWRAPYPLGDLPIPNPAKRTLAFLLRVVGGFFVLRPIFRILVWAALAVFSSGAQMDNGVLAHECIWSLLGVLLYFVGARIRKGCRPPLSDPTEKPVESEDGSMSVVTIDDPDRLSVAERAIQSLAGKASIFAMLNILTLLIIDAKILGNLQGKTVGTGQTEFGLLIACAALKVFLALKTFRFANQAADESATCPGNAYLANARGAKIATWICGAVTVAILAFGARMAF